MTPRALPHSPESEDKSVSGFRSGSSSIRSSGSSATSSSSSVRSGARSSHSGFTGGFRSGSSSVGGFSSGVGCSFRSVSSGVFSLLRASRERESADGDGSSENDLAHVWLILEQRVDQARHKAGPKAYHSGRLRASIKALEASMQALVASQPWAMLFSGVVIVLNKCVEDVTGSPNPAHFRRLARPSGGPRRQGLSMRRNVACAVQKKPGFPHSRHGQVISPGWRML